MLTPEKQEYPRDKRIKELEYLFEQALARIKQLEAIITKQEAIITNLQ